MPTAVLRILGHHLPGATFNGRGNVHVGLVRDDAAQARFDVPLEVVDADRSCRALANVSAASAGRSRRRHLHHVPARQATVGPAARQDRRSARIRGTVQAELDLTDSRGGPLCASIPPDLITWRIVG